MKEPSIRTRQFVRAARLREIPQDCDEARHLRAMAPPSTPDEAAREAIFIGSVHALIEGDRAASLASQKVLADHGELADARIAVAILETVSKRRAAPPPTRH